MSTAILKSLLDYLDGTLTPDNMLWLAGRLTESAQRREQQEPYTVEQLKQMVEDGRRQISAGQCTDSEELFARLDSKYHFAESSSAIAI